METLELELVAGGSGHAADGTCSRAMFQHRLPDVIAIELAALLPSTVSRLRHLAALLMLMPGSPLKRRVAALDLRIAAVMAGVVAAQS